MAGSRLLLLAGSAFVQLNAAAAALKGARYVGSIAIPASRMNLPRLLARCVVLELALHNIPALYTLLGTAPPLGQIAQRSGCSKKTIV